MRKPIPAILQKDYTYTDPSGIRRTIPKDTVVSVDCDDEGGEYEDVYGRAIVPETPYTVALDGWWYQILPGEFLFCC